MRLRIISLAVLCAVAAALVPAAASAKIAVGISENSNTLFGDSHFNSLGVKRTRLVVSWNAVAAAAKGDNEISDKIFPYLDEASKRGIDVLVSFQHTRGTDARGCGSRSKAARCKAPSVSAYKKQVTAFLKAFPTVKTISPWNEVNAGTQPTASNPKRVGQYAKAVDQICKSLKRKCTNVAIDVLDTADNTHAKKLKYTKTGRFIKKARKAYGKKPAVCGIHNYADVNRFRTNGTKQISKTLQLQAHLADGDGRHLQVRRLLEEGRAQVGQVQVGQRLPEEGHDLPLQEDDQGRQAHRPRVHLQLLPRHGRHPRLRHHDRHR